MTRDGPRATARGRQVLRQHAHAPCRSRRLRLVLAAAAGRRHQRRSYPHWTTQPTGASWPTLLTQPTKPLCTPPVHLVHLPQLPSRARPAFRLYTPRRHAAPLKLRRPLHRKRLQHTTEHATRPARSRRPGATRRHDAGLRRDRGAPRGRGAARGMPDAGRGRAARVPRARVPALSRRACRPRPSAATAAPTPARRATPAAAAHVPVIRTSTARPAAAVRSRRSVACRLL